jgi:hypothetical protein
LTAVDSSDETEEEEVRLVPGQIFLDQQILWKIPQCGLEEEVAKFLGQEIVSVRWKFQLG